MGTTDKKIPLDPITGETLYRMDGHTAKIGAKKRIMTSKKDVTIAKLRAKGESLTEIGKEVDLSKSRVHTICNRPDVKAIIDAEQARLTEFVPQAVKNMEHWIINATNKENDSVDKRIGYDATKELLQSTGILNNQPSHLVQILYQENNTIISPIIQNLLDGFMAKVRGVDAIDAEFKDVEKVPNTQN